MKAVWSFWTKPYLAHRRASWPSDKHHLLSWVLSVETARQHYPDTWLVTDDAGARLLVDGLGLQFARVSTDLNVLAQHDPDWWNLGKLYAYHLQKEPFVHIDNDVFIWKRLPQRLEGAAVLAQNPEPISAHTPYYQPERLELAIGSVRGGWLPDEWVWYRHTVKYQHAECCGLFGGNHIDFLNNFADSSLKLVDYPGNQLALRSLSDKRMHSLLIEQYLFAAFVEYHKVSTVSPFRNVCIEYLFSSPAHPWESRRAAEAGYTHLVAGAKRNPLIADKLERRVKEDYPKYYERCLKMLG